MKKHLGWKPSEFLMPGLTALISKREPDEVIIVHHYADNIDALQLEVERQSKTLGLAFERIILK